MRILQITLNKTNVTFELQNARLNRLTKGLPKLTAGVFSNTRSINQYKTVKRLIKVARDNARQTLSILDRLYEIDGSLALIGVRLRTTNSLATKIDLKSAKSRLEAEVRAIAKEVF